MGVADDEAGYGLVMPFVTVTDAGGPHDAESYACGWEMGRLDATLSVMERLNLRSHLTQIHTVNRAQADLIAMRYHLHAEFTEYEGIPEWLQVEFTPGPIEGDADVPED